MLISLFAERSKQRLSFVGNESDYILVADSLCNLHVIQNRQVRRIIKLPSIVTSVDASALVDSQI